MMKMNIWQIGRALVNHEVLPDEVFEKNSYRKFSINRYFSKCVKTLYIAENASLLHENISKEIHAKFISMSCVQGISMRSIGFSKKKDTSDALDRIIQFYHVNKNLACQYIKILEATGKMDEFMERTSPGGR
jgi:hypothetical protein